MRTPIENPADDLRAALEGTRWLIVAHEPAAADTLASALRSRGAVARLIDPPGLELVRLGAYDAQLLLADPSQNLSFLRERMPLHLGLRGASLLAMPWLEIWPSDASAPSLPRLVERARPLLAQDRALRRTAESEVSTFDVPEGRLGAVRTLRVLSSARDLFRVHFIAPGCEGRVDLAGELVLSASFDMEDALSCTGIEALGRALSLPSFRVRVERRIRPAEPTLVALLDRALELAFFDMRDREGHESPTLRMPSPLGQRASEPDVAPADEEPRSSLVDSTARDPQRVSGVVLRTPSEELPLPAPAAGVRTARIHTGLASRRDRWAKLGFGVAALICLIALSVLAWRRAQEHAATRAVPRTQVPTQAPEPALVRAARAAESTPDVAQPSGSAPEATSSDGTSADDDAAREAASPEDEASSDAKSASRTLITRAKNARSTSEARELLEQAITRNPNDTHALEELAERALEAGDAAVALRWAERAVALRPRRAHLHVLHGDALAALGRDDEARAAYQSARALAPTSRTIQRRLDARPR